MSAQDNKGTQGRESHILDEAELKDVVVGVDSHGSVGQGNDDGNTQPTADSGFPR